MADDLISALFPEEPSPQEQKLAQIAALRGQSPQPKPIQGLDLEALRNQRELGGVGQLTGDPALSHFGSGLIADANRQQSLDVQSKRNTALAQFHEDEVAARQQKANQLKFFRAGNGETLAGDPNTGQTTTLRAAPPPRPLSKSLGKGGAGGGVGGKDLDKALGLLRADIDPASGRGAGQFGKDYALSTSADKVLALINGPGGKPNYNLTVRQMPELVQSVASMLSSGNVAAQAQLEHLMPHTAGLSLAEKLEYVTGHPEEANQPEFVKQYAETAKREKALALQRIRAVQLRRLAAHAGVYGTNPNESKALAGQYLSDLSPEDLDSAFRGTYGAKPGASSAGGTVTIRRKTDGKTKTVPAGKAAQYLADPSFEAVPGG